MKKNRQEKILELIESTPIGTQDELITKLRECGYSATQATVSRDIRALRLVKTQSGGTFRYVRARIEDTGAEQDEPMSYRKTFGESIRAVNYSLNNVVIRTAPGMASAVAVLLDKTNHGMMLGCVAGDDTIIVVTRSADDSRTLKENIENQSG